MQKALDQLTTYLTPLDLSDWRYYAEVGSTNDIALDWALAGAKDYSLVIADTQSAGRGRENRRWVTQPGAALAMSLILRPGQAERGFIPRFTALPALALIEVLEKIGVEAQLKWPNDVLITGKKVAGVLVEADWQADQLVALVVGMGVNVSPESVPSADVLRYPATCIESELGVEVDRWAILASILHTLKRGREILPTEDFINVWNNSLAFKGDWVNFRFSDDQPRQAQVSSVQADGRLSLRMSDGDYLDVVAGEIEWSEPDGQQD